MAAKQAGGYKSASEVLQNEKTKLPNVTLMLLGKAGSGKSSLGNVILSRRGDNPPFLVNDNMWSKPSHNAVAVELFVHDRKVKVVDTPGVMDTSVGKDGQDSDEEALDGICDGISRCPEGVDAFLLVLRPDLRLTSEEFKAVAKLEAPFGDNFWRHVILVFTHEDSVQCSQEKVQEELEAATKISPEFKNLMSKLHKSTTAQLIDVSKHRNSDVADKQIQSLMSAVDALVAENKTKYTNELFLIAKDAMEKNKIMQMEDELRQLRDKLMMLEEAWKKDKETMKQLEEQITQKDRHINDGRKKVTEITRAGRECTIL